MRNINCANATEVEPPAVVRNGDVSRVAQGKIDISCFSVSGLGY